MVHAAITAEHVAITSLACEPPPIPRLRRPISDGIIDAGTRIGAWRVDAEIGRGGMAAVYAVAHAKYGKRAAMKIAHRSIIGERYTPETFHREARVMREVLHPGVADVLGIGSFGDRPYFLMEKLAGKTLGRCLDQGPMARADAIEILLELCDILRTAHAAGIVHRDLKLDNVFVVDTPYEEHRRVKLLDWGVAFCEDEPDPFRGLIAGTLTYVAPEQIRGETLTGACDVYSLAVIAFQLLCGRAPFAAAHELQLVHMHLRAEPPRARSIWQLAPEGIDNLLHAMLAKQPAERPSLDEVERVLRATRDAIAPARRPAFPTLVSLPKRPPTDVLGRPALPIPPFRAGWIGLAVALAGFAALLSALP